MIRLCIGLKEQTCTYIYRYTYYEQCSKAFMVDYYVGSYYPSYVEIVTIRQAWPMSNFLLDWCSCPQSVAYRSAHSEGIQIWRLQLMVFPGCVFEESSSCSLGVQHMWLTFRLSIELTRGFLSHEATSSYQNDQFYVWLSIMNHPDGAIGYPHVLEALNKDMYSGMYSGA